MEVKVKGKKKVSARFLSYDDASPGLRLAQTLTSPT